jgi:hypothetical protein
LHSDFYGVQRMTTHCFHKPSTFTINKCMCVCAWCTSSSYKMYRKRFLLANFFLGNWLRHVNLRKKEKIHTLWFHIFVVVLVHMMDSNSSNPNAKLIFCTACVAAPFNKLSNADTITTRFPSPFTTLSGDRQGSPTLNPPTRHS